MNEPAIEITPELLKLIAEIDEFKGRWQALQNLSPDRLQALRKVATIESVGSSTRIEGSKLSDKEVEALLGRVRHYKFKSRDEEEVAGYAHAMDIVFDSYTDIPLTENHIKQLHGILLKHSSKDTRHRGSYKTLSNNVEAFDTKGKSLGIIFETTSPFDTPYQMEKLIRWTNQALDDKHLHPLLIIGIFIVRFLAIHPFQDGNGRLSRIVTTLLLLKSGYVYVPFSSMESIVEQSKDAYYLALQRTQRTLQKKSIQWNPWLLFFLQTLKKQKDHLFRKIQNEALLAPLPALSTKLLQIIKEHGRLTVAQAVTLTQANRNTIKAHLKQLTEQKRIVLHGKNRGSWYTLS